MKTHTNQYKTNIKLLGKEIDNKITYTLNEEDIELGNEELNSVSPHYEGGILKSVMKQLDLDSNVDIPIGTEINYQFGLKVGNAYEYLNFGNYVVYSSEKQEDTNSWKIIAYDKMLYAMKDYESVTYTFPMTVRDYIGEICNTLGIGFANENDDFVNHDKELSQDMYLDANGASLGYTFRDVLDQLAEVTASTICINENDELEIRYIQNVGEYSTASGTTISIPNVDDEKDIDITLEGDTYQAQLPSEYQAVEYIQNSNYPLTYIDTGILWNGSNRICAEFETVSTGTNNNKLFVAANYNASTPTQPYIYINTSNNLVGVGATVSGSVIGDKVDVKYTSTSGNKIFITTWSDTTWGSTFQYKYFKIYKDDILLRDYVPCYRKSDNAIGMYDFVENKFYANNGTGSFVKGNNVALPTPDIPQDVQVAEGEQIIKIHNKNIWNLGDLDIGWAYSSSSLRNLFNSLKEGTYTFTLNYKVKSIVQETNNNIYGIIAQNSAGGFDARKNAGVINVNDTYTQTITTTITSSKVGKFTNIYLYGFGNDSVGRTANGLLFNVQFEKGNTATKYVDHVEKTFPISLKNKNLSTLPQNTQVPTGETPITILDFGKDKTFSAITLSLICDNVMFTNNNGALVDFLKNDGTHQYRLPGHYNMPKDTLLNSTYTRAEANITFRKVNIYLTLGYSHFTQGKITTMLNEGSTALPYTPYYDPIWLGKITDNYKDKIDKSNGNNLFNIQTVVKGRLDNGVLGYADGTSILTLSDNSISFTTTTYWRGVTTDYIKVQENTNYIFNSSLQIDGSTKGIFVACYDKNKTFIQNFTTIIINDYTRKIITPSNTKYIRINFQIKDAGSITIYNPMLNKGNTPLEYEPYGNNEWYLKKALGKVVLNGSETWDYYTETSKPVFYLSTLTNYKQEASLLCYSNYFIGKGETATFDNVYDYGNNVIAFRTTFKRLVIRADDFTSTNSLKTWLTTHNTNVYYVLDTPTYEKITNQELIDQLNAIELLEGVNEITVDSVNLPSLIEVKYLSQRDTIDGEYLKDVNVNFGEKYGKVNSIVLSRSAGADNIFEQDTESIEENGLCEIKIIDNQIMSGNDRADYLLPIFNKLKGLEYYINDFSSTGITFYDLCDKYNVKIGDNKYGCIMFNDEININQGLEELVYTDMPEESETDYTKADKTDRKINQAYSMVDKQNGIITNLVSQTTQAQELNNQRILDLTQRTNSVEQRITSTEASIEVMEQQIVDGQQTLRNNLVTIDINGINVSTNVSAISTLMTNEKFVIRSGNTNLAFFGYDSETNSTKAEMDNLTITNYLTAGYHRVEKITINGENRTGYFYIGGGN